MKLTSKQTRTFLRKQPVAEYPVLMFFGHAVDVMRQHCQKILQNADIDRRDAFQYLRLHGSELKNNPLSLHHEACSSSLTMQKRWIMVQGKASEMEAAITSLCVPGMANRFGENQLLIIIEELNTKAALLRKCADCPWIAAIPCYEADRETLYEYLEDFCHTRQWQCSDDAKALLIDYAERNFDNLQHLLDKIALYGADGGVLDTKTIAACHDDDTQQNLQDFALIAFSGRSTETDILLRSLLDQKISTIALIRSLSEHTFKLLRLLSIAEESSLEQAFQQHRPPIFFKQVPVFRQQCHRWSQQQLRSLLQQLSEQEIRAKSTQFYDDILIRQFALRLSKMA